MILLYCKKEYTYLKSRVLEELSHFLVMNWQPF